MNYIDAEILNLLPFFLFKVLIATICGMIIGIDRELKQKVAGVRTFILISVGCAIFTSIATLMSDGTLKSGHVATTKVFPDIHTFQVPDVLEDLSFPFNFLYQVQ